MGLVIIPGHLEYLTTTFTRFVNDVKAVVATIPTPTNRFGDESLESIAKSLSSVHDSYRSLKGLSNNGYYMEAVSNFTAHMQGSSSQLYRLMEFSDASEFLMLVACQPCVAGTLSCVAWASIYGGLCQPGNFKLFLKDVSARLHYQRTALDILQQNSLCKVYQVRRVVF